MRELLLSLLELGDITSQNLAFVHQQDGLSYGEETITENNLLELRRRHPQAVKLKAFGKKAESKNGADWEWHIIGQRYRFGMRVQAKRLQKDGKLKIQHLVGSQKTPQIDLLLKDAKKHQLAPIYCFYCTESQREQWKKGAPNHTFVAFEAGCLLAPASRVKTLMPTSLDQIEKECVPWHYLALEAKVSKTLKRRSSPVQPTDVNAVSFVVASIYEFFNITKVMRPKSWNFPTMAELNEGGDSLLNTVGVSLTEDGHAGREMPDDWYQERGVGKLIVIDLRRLTVDRAEPGRRG